MAEESPKDDVTGRKARLRSRLHELVGASVHDRADVPAEAHPVDQQALEADPLAGPPAADSPGWAPLAPGEPWGAERRLLVWGYPADGGGQVWLRATAEVPDGWSAGGTDDEVLVGLDDPRAGTHGVGMEGLLYVDGAVYAGLDDPHRWAPLPAPHGSYPLHLACTVSTRRPFAGLQLRRRHRPTWQLGVLGRTLLGVAAALPEGDVTAAALYAALDRAYRSLDLRHGWQHENLRAAATEALAALREAVPAGDHGPRIVASGHAHLDVAWLWPVWRTRQKVAHTVATALHLMDRYPDYRFSLSAPQTWQFVADGAPELYRRLLDRTAEGRLEPVGVFWLESDGNLPSGESFVRQVRHGTRFYREQVGRVPNAAWLPDSFGFTAALPTVLAGFGIRTLMTTKLSWNRVNRMPADTFRWRGPDGSEVLAHFVTTSSTPVKHPTDPSWHTYAGNMNPDEVSGVWAHYRGKDLSDEILYLYGHGDGGGGPTEEMVEAAQAMRDLPGFPHVSLGRADEFFDRLHARVWDDERLPTWSGDLYFEMHRGTYTSQARTKRGNRDGELALREAEWADAWAVLDGAPSRQAELDDAWITVLRNQFHDILPGSSIPRVYVDAAAEHAAVRETCSAVTASALAAVLGRAPEGAAPVTVNSLSWPREEVVEGPDGALRLASAPSFGWRAGPPVATTPDRWARARATPQGWAMENELVRAVFDDRGELVSLQHKPSGLETVAPGTAANRLVLFEDRPLFWDAWDVDAFYADKPVPVDGLDSGALLDGHGGLRAGLRLTRRTGGTTIVQTVTLDAGSPRLDVRTEVDWQERNMLLRVLSGWAVNARHATVGRQFGSIEHVLHRNTTWEQARFEFAAHGWLDVSDGAGGVALLTDAIYGHSAHQGPDGTSQVGLSLLKAGAWPDPDADRGAHVLRYALMPHAGTWQQAGVPQRALELAAPLRSVPAAATPGSVAAQAEASLLAVDAGHVVAETVKTAWDGDGLVVRLHEAHNRRGTARLRLDRPIGSAVLTDLAEQEVRALPVDGHTVTVELAPHQLATVRIRPA
jgi:alpha-mannosidase